MRFSKHMIQLESPMMRCWGCWYKPRYAKVYVHGSAFDRGVSVIQRHRQKGDWTAGSEVQATHGAIMRELPESISNRARHGEVILILASLLATTNFVVEHYISSDTSDDTLGLVEPLLAIGDTLELPTAYDPRTADRSAISAALVGAARATTPLQTFWGSGPSGEAPRPVPRPTAVETRNDEESPARETRTPYDEARDVLEHPPPTRLTLPRASSGEQNTSSDENATASDYADESADFTEMN